MDYAAKNTDNNLFSSLDDNNNFGSAINSSIVLGNRNMAKKSAWVTGKYFYISPVITDAVVSAYDLNATWDDTTGTTGSGKRESWESSAGGSLGNNTYAEATYGQYIANSRLAIDRISGKVQYKPGTPVTLAYDGSFFRHYAAAGTNTTLRDNVQMLYTSSKISATSTYKDEWRTLADSLNRGSIGAGLSLSLLPLSLTQEVFYSVFRRGKSNLYAAKDTGHSIQVNEEFRHSFSANWNTGISGKYYLESHYGKENTSSVLVTASNDFAVPARGFSSQQKYQVTMEKAATYAQTPVYVGTGLGDYVWSDSLQQYIPAKNGNYIIQEQELFGSSSDNRVRKTQLTAFWSLYRTKKRLPGILGDVDWYGVLNVEENLRLDAPLHASSWIPGYTALFGHNALVDTMIPTANVSYRQNIDWSPDSMPGLKGTLYVQPSLHKIRDYSERGTEFGGTINKTIKKWVIGTEVALLGVMRLGVQSSSSENTYQVSDRKLELNERLQLPRNVSLYFKETGGWSEKKSADGTDNGWYFRGNPGIVWQVIKKGQAELSYTYSTVSIPGTLDYRMAQGFASGTTHTLNAIMHMNFGTRFSGDILYKGEFGNKAYAKSGLHVVSMQMKAFL